MFDRGASAPAAKRDEEVKFASPQRVMTFNAGVAAVGLGVFAASFLLTAGLLPSALFVVGLNTALSAGMNYVAARKARMVSPENWDRSARLLKEVCQGMNLRTPELLVVDIGVPNAAAQQMIKRRVMVTTGLLNKMSDYEINGILAHEMAHLRNRDSQTGLARFGALMAGFFFLPTAKVLGLPAAVAPIYNIGANVAFWALMMTGVRWREKRADLYVAEKTDFGPNLAKGLEHLDGKGARGRGFLRGVFRSHPYTPDRVAYVAKASELRRLRIASTQVSAPIRATPNLPNRHGAALA